MNDQAYDIKDFYTKFYLRYPDLLEEIFAIYVLHEGDELDTDELQPLPSQ
jgi:hypothetical protein